MTKRSGFVMSLITAMALATGALTVAQEGVDEAPLTHVAGTFNDYVWVEGNQGFGPWHVTGDWSARVNTQSRKGEFIGSLLGVRSDLWVLQTAADPANPALRNPHTHHVSLPDATVTFISNGVRLEGTAIITVNGSVAGYSGSTVQVEITGGNLIRYSNIKLTFLGTGGVDHFGPQAYEGLVVLGR
jgi:hypothetical protein